MSSIKDTKLKGDGPDMKEIVISLIVAVLVLIVFNYTTGGMLISNFLGSSAETEISTEAESTEE